MKNQRRFLSKTKKELIITSIWAVVFTAGIIASPILTKIILNIIENNNGNITILFLCTLSLAIFYFVQVLINIFWNLSLDNFGGKYVKEVSNVAMKSIISSKYSEIESIGENKLKSILFNDIFDCFRVVGKFIPNCISSILVLICSFILGAFSSTTIVIILFISVLIGVGLSFLSKNKLSKVGRSTNNSMKQINSQRVDFVDSIIEVETNQLLKNVIDDSDASINNFISTAKAEDKKTFFWNGIVENYNTLISLIISIIIAFYISEGTINNLIFFTVLINLVISSSFKIEMSLSQIFKMKVSVENVNKIINLRPRTGKIVVGEINSIEIENVCFKYNESYVLKNLNTNLKKGDVLKLNGKNGSGKSTLIKLIMNLYDASSGKISFNGIDIENIEYASLLNSILFVKQDEKIPAKNLNIYFNSLNNDKNDDGERVNSLMNKFGLKVDSNYELINNGSNLSPGQKKKILC